MSSLSMFSRSKHTQSQVNLPTKSELSGLKLKQEYEMGRVMRAEIESMEIKKVTERKYDMLLKKERE